MTRNTLRRTVIPAICLILIFTLIPHARAAESDTAGALQAILQGYEDHAESVDLSAYNITQEELHDLYYTAKDAGQFPWYAWYYSYKYYTSTGYVSTLTYIDLDPEEYDYELFERRAAEILAETVYDGMDQWQIALSIHDYLAANCAYDETYTYYTGYDVITRGTAVCAGYAWAYMFLLNRVGIPCRYISSEEMDHAWNLVQIGGQWYHVDVTWDDPTSDREGQVLHDYFLISDAAISDEDHNHSGWVTDIQCTDTTLDTNRFWQGIDSQICYESADTCYFRQKTGDTAYTVYSRDSVSGDQKKVASTDAGYIDIGGSKDAEYFYQTNGLTLWNGRLYYADMTKVYSVNPDGSGKKTVYSHAYKSNKTYISGCHVVDGTLYLTLADHDQNLSTMQLSLDGDAHVHSYSAETVEPTCTQPGCTVHTCSCGVRYETDYVPAVEHTYGEGLIVREATAYQDGLLRYTCIHCGAYYEEVQTYTPSVTVGSHGQTGTSSGSDTEPNYTARRIVAGAVIIILITLMRKKKKKK